MQSYARLFTWQTVTCSSSFPKVREHRYSNSDEIVERGERFNTIYLYLDYVVETSLQLEDRAAHQDFPSLLKWLVH